MPKLFDLNKNNPYVNPFLKLPKSADDFKKKTENKQPETKQKEKTNEDKSIDDLMSQVDLLEKVERRTPAFTESGGVYISNAKQKQALRNEINSLNSVIKRKATTLSREELEERIKNNENRKFQLNAPMATTNRSSVKDYSTILEIGRLTNENNMYSRALEIRKQRDAEEFLKKKERDFINYAEEYYPIVGLTRDEYNRRRRINKSLPEFGSYQYFLNREKEIGAELEKINGQTTYQKNAHRYAGSSLYRKPGNIDKEYADIIASEYENIAKALSDFNKGVNYDSYGNVDVNSGIRENRQIESMYNKIDTYYRWAGKDNPLSSKGYITPKYHEKSKLTNLASKLARNKIEAYEYFFENKDNVYENNLYGRVKGNYRVGDIGEKTGSAGYTSYQNNTDDIEAAEVYQLLQKRLVEKNQDTFENNNRLESTVATISGYLPQFKNQKIQQLGGMTVGAVVGTALGNPILGARLGSAAVSADYMFKQTAGSKYVQLLQESNLSVEDAKILAANTALSASVVEFGLDLAVSSLWKGGKAVYKAVGAPGKNVVSDTIEFFVKKGVPRKIAEKAVKYGVSAGKFAVNSLVESGGEWIQQGMDLVADRYARQGKTATTLQIFTEAFDFSKYTDDEMRQMNEVFKSSVVINFASGGVNSAGYGVINKIVGNVNNENLGAEIKAYTGNLGVITNAVKFGFGSDNNKIRELAVNITQQLKNGVKNISDKNLGELIKNALSNGVNVFKNNELYTVNKAENKPLNKSSDNDIIYKEPVYEKYQPNKTVETFDYEGYQKVVFNTKEKYQITDVESFNIERYVGGLAFELNGVLLGNPNYERTPVTDYWIENIIKGLKKMPDYEGRTYRNLTFESKEAFEDFMVKFKIGERVNLDNFSSTSKDPNGYVVPGEYIVHMVFDGVNGKDISDTYSIPGQKEVIYLPNTQIDVADVKTANDGHPLIYVKEVVSNGKNLETNSGKYVQDSTGTDGEGYRGNASGERLQTLGRIYADRGISGNGGEIGESKIFGSDDQVKTSEKSNDSKYKNKPKTIDSINELRKYIYGLLDRVSGYSKFKNIESAINRIKNGDAKLSDLELFKTGNDFNRKAFYKKTGIKLPEDEHGTVLQLLFLNEKFAIQKDFPTIFFGKYYGTKSNSIDLSLSELYNEYISTLKDADTPKNAPEHIKTRNQKLEGKTHPVTGVPFVRKVIEVNGRKYTVVVPEFESKFDAKISEDLYFKRDRVQFKECNRQLCEAVKNNPELAGQFTKKQLKKIENEETPDGYIWHHDAESGKLQLVDRKLHEKTGHTGGKKIWGGGSKFR